MQENNPEDWLTWTAVYHDGTVIQQKEFKVSYEDLDREKLHEFQMWRKMPDGSDALVFVAPFKEGQGNRLIWRRRVQVTPGGETQRFYVIGKRGAFVACLFDNGVTVVDDNFTEGHAIYGDVQPVKGELGYTPGGK